MSGQECPLSVYGIPLPPLPYGAAAAAAAALI
jgi:hypothetical protein